jgi:hypothetical protein
MKLDRKKAQTVAPAGGKPRQAASITEYELDDDVVLYDPRNDSAHVLNGTAAFVWSLCDGDHTIEQIADELGGVFKLSPGKVLADVQAALKNFGDAGLVT